MRHLVRLATLGVGAVVVVVAMSSMVRDSGGSSDDRARTKVTVEHRVERADASSMPSDRGEDRIEIRSTASGRSPSTPPEAQARTTRALRIRGRVLIDGGPSSTQATDPALAGIAVRVVESGASATVSDGGTFLIETDIPARLRTVTLRYASDMLLPTGGNRDVRVALAKRDAESSELDVETHMVRAPNVQPMYKGRVITPADLSDPDVREEFERQIVDSATKLFGPPPADVPSFSGAGEKTMGDVADSGMDQTR